MENLHHSWCECGDPALNWIFVEDLVCEALEKHHYHCRNCGGVKQIG